MTSTQEHAPNHKSAAVSWWARHGYHRRSVARPGVQDEAREVRLASTWKCWRQSLESPRTRGRRNISPLLDLLPCPDLIQADAELVRFAAVFGA